MSVVDCLILSCLWFCSVYKCYNQSVLCFLLSRCLSLFAACGTLSYLILELDNQVDQAGGRPSNSPVWALKPTCHSCLKSEGDDISRMRGSGWVMCSLPLLRRRNWFSSLDITTTQCQPAWQMIKNIMLICVDLLWTSLSSLSLSFTVWWDWFCHYQHLQGTKHVY